MRRHHEGAGEAALAEPLHHQLRVEPVQELAEATEEDGGQREDETAAVEQRREREVGVVGPVAAVFRRHAEAGEDPRAVGEHDALGRAGGAGRVGDGEGLPLLRRRVRLLRCGTGEPFVVAPAEHQRPLDPLERGAAGKLFAGLIDHQHARPAIAADRLELARREPRVDRGDRRTHRREPSHDLDIFEAVQGEQHHPVAGDQAEIVPGAGAHSVDPLDQLPVGERRSPSRRATLSGVRCAAVRIPVAMVAER